MNNLNNLLKSKLISLQSTVLNCSAAECVSNSDAFPDIFTVSLG